MRPPELSCLDPERWEYVQFSATAKRARAAILFYTLALTLPFVALSASASYLCGLFSHEVTGIACYHAMITSIIMFDTLRNAAHACFAEAWELGFVTVRDGIPVITEDYAHRRLAQLSFAVGGYLRDEK